MEELSAIEPLVSEQYLNSGPDVLPLIENIFDQDGSITVKPKALENSDYYLTLKIEPNGNSPMVVIELSDAKGDPIIFTTKSDIDRTPGATLGFGEDPKGQLRVAGSVGNFSDKGVNSPNPAIRNITGVIAPYEDAFCLALAKKSGKSVIRQVGTSHRMDSRMVQNYLKRGYVPEDPDSEKGGAIEKTFYPPSNL
jgi:hypothetical protein